MIKVKENKKEKKVNKPTKKIKASKETKTKVEKLATIPKITVDDDKQKIIDKFGQKKGDTGSPEVQVALLSLKIDKLAEHLDINKKDNHSRRGLLKVIAKRRRILNYLEKLDEKRYKKLIKEIGLKK